MSKLSNVMKTLLLFLLLILVFNLFIPTPVSGQAESDLSLALYVAPDKLPADEGRYSSLIVQLERAGDPTAAPSDIQVTLSSSDETVGTVDPQITIPKGQTHTVTSFQTTRTVGETTITALAREASTGSVKVTTVTPTGTPFKLGLYAAPSSIPAEPGRVSRIIVQLEDSRGLPTKAPSTITVSLTLSEANVGFIGEEQVTIRTGETQTSTTFHANHVAGSVEISASAKGYASASTTLTTVGQVATKLALYALPPKLHVADSFGWLTVQLQDSNSKPAKATSDTYVILTSTDPNVAYPATSVTIRTGETQATTRLIILTDGSVTITATSEGYTAVSVSVTITPFTYVDERTLTPPPVASIGLTVAPSIIPSDNNVYTVIAVQLLDSDGLPTWLRTPTSISFSSSDSTIGLASAAYIEGRHSYALADFQTTYTPGTTTLFTVAKGYSTTSASITTYGLIADRITLSLTPPLIYADGEMHEPLVVQLQDSSNKPVKTYESLIVSLYSSEQEVGGVESQVTIPRGSDHAIAKFYSTNTPGSTVIEALAEGYITGTVTVTTTKAGPSAFALFAAPSKLVANGASYNSIFIQSLDSGGSPTITWSDITLKLFSNNPEVGTVNSEVTIPKGSVFTITEFHSGTVAGETTIDVLSEGFELATLKISTILLPASLTIEAEPESILVNEESNLNVTVTSAGSPVSSAQVQLETDLGSFDSNILTTKEDGNATAKYFSSQPGNATIIATVITPGYETVNSTINIIVSFPKTPTAPSPSPEAETKPSIFQTRYIIIGGVAAGAAAGAIFLRRRFMKPAT